MSCCVDLTSQLVDSCNQFGYGEIRQGRYSYQSTLMHTFERISNPKFISVTIADKADVYPALRSFFGAEVSGRA